ncbi:bacteriocin [Clostridium thermosuccinogenes]|jgi:uncharacterized linocin/CFP29 family protein|uniref:Type 1 encapsulin shell protein n=1 Tax=Clostridium thermosuccinogenes TaxID=84032 RepID=A0A2K2FH56_9CLOT|nr:family 1 encapsulin nanocompartment shell protein [Pseudoclostridium thermosuccinogenes]AUS97738.1 bacteriocin [Pseudoclostridium thermosuccinogenes]PNT93980.1 bacteriocin [Pseudoclostridium thermosuccinogenes]PNT98102.1 bacteriocin [Pseudoclostridium thermosuccinogenes]PNU00073.1 bacteriocin [Pseudoclostridium thermosuccinogenes]
MDYLSREGSPISSELWSKIDDAVVSMAKQTLVGRRFLEIYGPLGAGVQSINVDDLSELEETGDGLVKIKGRRYEHIPLIKQDFSLLWRDLEASEQSGLPVDLSAAMKAAAKCARKEDELIFLGNEEMGYKGLLTEEGITRLQKGDWNEGENPVRDVAKGLAKFVEYGLVGRKALIVSPDIFMQLQRIQPGTGITEYDRLQKLINGNIFTTPVLGMNNAILVCAEKQYMDLAIGQDMVTAYLETRDLNHYFRIIETVLLRIKNKKAVVAFE